MENSTTNPSTKQLALIVKCGPAFSLDELERSHAALDTVDVPRILEGHVLSLDNRIHWLLGILSSERKYNAILQDVYVERSR